MELTDDALISVPTKELNSLLHALSKNEALKVKQRKRTLKNKMYARTSRSKTSPKGRSRRRTTEVKD